MRMDNKNIRQVNGLHKEQEHDDDEYQMTLLTAMIVHELWRVLLIGRVSLAAQMG